MDSEQGMESSLARVWTVFRRATESDLSINSSSSLHEGNRVNKLLIDLKGLVSVSLSACLITFRAFWLVYLTDPLVFSRAEISAGGKSYSSAATSTSIAGDVFAITRYPRRVKINWVFIQSDKWLFDLCWWIFTSINLLDFLLPSLNVDY